MKFIESHGDCVSALPPGAILLANSGAKPCNLALWHIWPVPDTLVDPFKMYLASWHIWPVPALYCASFQDDSKDICHLCESDVSPPESISTSCFLSRSRMLSEVLGLACLMPSIKRQGQ